MAKKKIRLTESELIKLIKKSMISEQAPTNTTIKLDDATLRDVAGRVVDLMLGDVENSDVEKIQEILQDEVFGTASARTGKCAYKQFDKFYASKAAEKESWTDGTGNTGSLKGDLDAADIQTDAVKDELIGLINDENKFCRTLEAPPAATQQTTTQQTNNFACVESESTFRAYGTSPNQYGEVQWQGGTLQFYLDARPLGDGAPADNNILYQKGGKKWTTKGSCSEGGPGKQRGLVLGAWTVKTN
jgi:hypothetical protein